MTSMTGKTNVKVLDINMLYENCRMLKEEKTENGHKRRTSKRTFKGKCVCT